MKEIIIRSDNEDAIQKLAELVKLFDFEVVNVQPVSLASMSPKLPINYAKKPDFMALAGIWAGRKITLEEIREKAWGSRVG